MRINHGHQGCGKWKETSGFITGINYWPAQKAMYWWRNFDVLEVEEDFKRMAEGEFRLVRIFLTWEDFQPVPDQISVPCIDNLKKAADLASFCGIQLMPTFFCGHMSGINWLPEWMLAPGEGNGRFPVFSNNHLTSSRLRNCYVEPEVTAAQCLQIETVAGELKGHEAIWAYDLGNEASNWAVPPNRSAGRRWLARVTASLKKNDPEVKVTLGMHAEDLEEDRSLWPQDAAGSCDFLSMHGYPFYLSWVNNPLDSELVPFLGIITAWLGQKPVLFQEFGVPTRAAIAPWLPADYETHCHCPLWSEYEAAVYCQEVIRRLRAVGMMGGLAWCYADYSPLLWQTPPLDKCLHERHFGLYRHDGQAKPAVDIFPACKNSPEINDPLPSYPWLNEAERNNFYHNPRNNLINLYQEYKEWIKEL